MYISNAQSKEEGPSSTTKQRFLKNSSDLGKGKPRQRSRSLDTYRQPRAKELIERMKHTFEYKLNEPKGHNSYKGNIRGEYIQALFATLEDLLTKLPPVMKFDIEISKFLLYHGGSEFVPKANDAGVPENIPCYSKPMTGAWNLPQ